MVASSLATSIFCSLWMASNTFWCRSLRPSDFEHVEQPRVRAMHRAPHHGHAHELDVVRLVLQPALHERLERVAVRAAVPEHFDDFDLAGARRWWAAPARAACSSRRLSTGRRAAADPQASRRGARARRRRLSSAVSSPVDSCEAVASLRLGGHARSGAACCAGAAAAAGGRRPRAVRRCGRFARRRRRC